MDNNIFQSTDLNPSQNLPPTVPTKPDLSLIKILLIIGLIIFILVVGLVSYILGQTSVKPTILIIPTITQAVQKACTLEAKICPDGSSVGRTGPNCEFAPCPKADYSTITKGESNFKTYINSKMGYSLSYPNNWVFVELITGGGATFKLVDGTEVVLAQYFNKTDISLVKLKEYVLIGAVKEYPNFQNINSIKEVVTDSNMIGYQVIWNYIPAGQKDLSATKPITYFQSIDEKSTIKISLLNSKNLSEYENIIKSFKTDKDLIVIQTTECIKEGESGNYFDKQKCCSESIELSTSDLEFFKSKCSPVVTNGSFVCGKCGNGICGSGENKCNCSQDCK